jgi:predicted phosphoadenosine phosphosulfate sulfurtransferase
MTPLVVQAHLGSPVAMGHPVAFDALLAAVVASGDRLPPPTLGFSDVEIPLLRHPRGFHHASQAHLVVAESTARYWARRPPDIRVAAALSSSQCWSASGRHRAFWCPLRLMLPAGMTLTWWAVGDRAEVEDLLQHVLTIGARRGSGHGWVARWIVDEVQTDLSIHTLDGTPARNIPVDMMPEDWPYVRTARTTYPYWASNGAEQCAVPAPASWSPGDENVHSISVGTGKAPLGIDVLAAARQRISRVFDDFERIYVSFSGGKDSTVMTHLVAEEARTRGRRFGVLFVDLEAQYRLTIEHVDEVRRSIADVADFDWVCLPLILRNAVSQYEPRWLCWEPGRDEDWVRTPPEHARKDEATLPFFRRGMEFEEFVPEYGEWYADGSPTACLVGIRADESLNRYRTIKRHDKRMHERLPWTTAVSKNVVNAYPIYDWRVEDIWKWHSYSGMPHNRLYDRMYEAGLSIHEQRICQPYGDDQRKGLWLYQVIEPETWGRVVARVNGANQGAMYARESGNILGRIKVTKPPGHTWHTFARLLLDTMPERLRAHYEAKLLVFLKWYEARGYPDGIPDEADLEAEAKRAVPTWRRICKSLLRNDYRLKGLSFTQTKPDAYDAYMDLMQRRRDKWGLTI